MIEAKCRRCGETFNPDPSDVTGSTVVHFARMEGAHEGEECGATGDVLGYYGQAPPGWVDGPCPLDPECSPFVGTSAEDLQAITDQHVAQWHPAVLGAAQALAAEVASAGLASLEAYYETCDANEAVIEHLMGAGFVDPSDEATTRAWNWVTDKADQILGADDADSGACEACDAEVDTSAIPVTETVLCEACRAPRCVVYTVAVKIGPRSEPERVEQLLRNAVLAMTDSTIVDLPRYAGPDPDTIRDLLDDDAPRLDVRVIASRPGK